MSDDHVYDNVVGEPQRPTLASLMDLYEKIKHGSATHRQWLWDAIVAWSKGKEIPEPYE